MFCADNLGFRWKFKSTLLGENEADPFNWLLKLDIGKMLGNQ